MPSAQQDAIQVEKSWKADWPWRPDLCGGRHTECACYVAGILRMPSAREDAIQVEKSLHADWPWRPDLRGGRHTECACYRSQSAVHGDGGRFDAAVFS
jgi:hypothetical protein